MSIEALSSDSGREKGPWDDFNSDNHQYIDGSTGELKKTPETQSDNIEEREARIGDKTIKYFVNKTPSYHSETPIADREGTIPPPPEALTENVEYRKVDTKEYVEQGLADGSLEVFEATKHARINAVKGEVGQEVISWSEDENGNPVQEKVATVSANEETGETGWVVTKTDTDGNPIVDKNGHLNQWVIDDKTFHKKYEADPEHPGVFMPTGGPQKFVKTKENLAISQWGEEMNMPAGSFINITNPDDMYAVNPRDFDDTYTISEKESDNAA